MGLTQKMIFLILTLFTFHAFAGSGILSELFHQDRIAVDKNIEKE